MKGRARDWRAAPRVVSSHAPALALKLSEVRRLLELGLSADPRLLKEAEASKRAATADLFFANSEAAR